MSKLFDGLALWLKNCAQSHSQSAGFGSLATHVYVGPQR